MKKFILINQLTHLKLLILLIYTTKLFEIIFKTRIFYSKNNLNNINFYMFIIKYVQYRDKIIYLKLNSLFLIYFYIKLTLLMYIASFR